MFKPKPTLIPLVWQYTDYVVYRFDYFSIGTIRNEIARVIKDHFPDASFLEHKLKKEDLEIVDIDTMAYNLKLSLDEVNNETVYRMIHYNEDPRYVYEIYAGRYFTQIIYRKDSSTKIMPDFENIVFLLDYFLNARNLNIVKMTCIVHAQIDKTIDEIINKTEPAVTTELLENNVFKALYSDSREINDLRLESKRTILRKNNADYKLDINGVSYYTKLTEAKFLSAYKPLMNAAMLENTRYFKL